jgi:hypothetical protein
MIDEHGRGFVLRIAMTSDRRTEQDDEDDRGDHGAAKRQPGMSDRRNRRGRRFVSRIPAIARRG